MKTTDISTAVLNPNGDDCNISRFGASHGSAFRFAIGHHRSKPGCAIPAKKPGLAPKRLICAASPNGSEEIAHRSPQAKLVGKSCIYEAFLDFVLAHYVNVGVEELDQEKLTPLLRLKYDSISDAIADLGGKPDEIGKVFAGFQKYLYERFGT